jgi:hypothetical protein
MPDLRQGCTTGKNTEETTPADALVLFGAMGDLAHKKIFPALYNMVRHGHLDVPVIGVARAARTDEHLKERVRDSIQQQGGDIDQEALAKILKLLRYVGGDYEKPETFDLLKMFALSIETTTCTLVQIVRRARSLSDRNPMKLITSARSTLPSGFSRHDWRKYSRAVLY